MKEYNADELKPQNRHAVHIFIVTVDISVYLILRADNAVQQQLIESLRFCQRSFYPRNKSTTKLVQ